MKKLANIKSKLLVCATGFLVALLALPFGSAAVYADQANGYWLTSTTSATPSAVWLKGTNSPDVSTVKVDVRGRDQSSPYGSDVILIIDASGSMSGQPTTDELVAAKSFISSMDPASDQVSVIPFAEYAPQAPEAIQALTTDFTTAKSYVDNVENLMTLGGGTNYESALDAATAEFASPRARADANKVLIFMSDGADGGNDPIVKATAMKASGINIYSIGLDSSSDSSGLDSSASDLLKAMSSSTVGTNDHYFEAPSSAQLSAIYASVSQSIANSVATKVKLTLKLSSSVEVVAGSWSIAPTTSVGGVYTFDLPDALSNRTTALTFQVKVVSGTPGQTIQVLDATGSIIDYTDALSVVSTAAVNNQSLAIIAPPVVVPPVVAPIKAPDTAVKQFVLANPIVVAVFGILAASTIILAARRQLGKK